MANDYNWIVNIIFLEQHNIPMSSHPTFPQIISYKLPKHLISREILGLLRVAWQRFCFQFLLFFLKMSQLDSQEKWKILRPLLGGALSLLYSIARGFFIFFPKWQPFQKHWKFVSTLSLSIDSSAIPVHLQLLMLLLFFFHRAQHLSRVNIWVPLVMPYVQGTNIRNICANASKWLHSVHFNIFTACSRFPFIEPGNKWFVTILYMSMLSCRSLLSLPPTYQV